MMQNVSEIPDGPIMVWMTLVSRTGAGSLDAETVIRSSDGVSVLEVRRHSDVFQCLMVSAPSSGVVSRLAYRVAGLALVDEVRVQRCLDNPRD
jgi:hypothetical protein